jgi:NADH-quinone oxidoreductase subunit C
MPEGKGIPWKGKAAERGGSLAATDPNYKPAAPAPKPAAAAPAAPAAPAPGAKPAAPAARPAGAGGKAIPWKGKAAQRAAEAPAAPAAPAPAARPAAGAPARPAGPPPVIDALKERFPELKFEMRHGYAEVTLAPEQLLEAARLARDRFGYDYLSAVTAVDWQDRFEILYHCYSYNYQKNPSCLVLRVPLPREAHPLIPSVTGIWPGADFQEREIYDLMGVKFVGHPDLRRILLSDDFPGHPLRKDYQIDYSYVLVHHLRAGAEGGAEQIYNPPHIARQGEFARPSANGSAG